MHPEVNKWPRHYLYTYVSYICEVGEFWLIVDRKLLLKSSDFVAFLTGQSSWSNESFLTSLLQLPFTSPYFQLITPSGADLNTARNLRDIVVYVSDNLSWSTHIASKRIFILSFHSNIVHKQYNCEL